MSKKRKRTQVSTIKTTKQCQACFNLIDINATVCPKCQKHQGILGWFYRAGLVLTVIVSLLAVVITLFNANKTHDDREEVTKAYDEALIAQEISAKANLKILGQLTYNAFAEVGNSCRLVTSKEAMQKCIERISNITRAASLFADIADLQGKRAKSQLKYECDNLSGGVFMVITVLNAATIVENALEAGYKADAADRIALILPLTGYTSEYSRACPDNWSNLEHKVEALRSELFETERNE